MKSRYKATRRSAPQAVLPFGGASLEVGGAPRAAGFITFVSIADGVASPGFGSVAALLGFAASLASFAFSDGTSGSSRTESACENPVESSTQPSFLHLFFRDSLVPDSGCHQPLPLLGFFLFCPSADTSTCVPPSGVASSARPPRPHTVHPHAFSAPRCFDPHADS